MKQLQTTSKIYTAKRKFQTKKNSTKICNKSFCRCSVSQIIQFGACLFFINNIILHWMLEIALAIPASNESKIQHAIEQHKG